MLEFLAHEYADMRSLCAIHPCVEKTEHLPDAILKWNQISTHMAQQKTVSFAEIMLSFTPRYELHRVFDDFLTMSIASCGRNPETGLSYDEDLYLETIAPYKDDPLRFAFGTAFGQLVLEMTDRIIDQDGRGWDVMGEFFEQYLITPVAQKKKGQIFTPWAICRFMAEITRRETAATEVLHILDPACGSGRMHLAASRVFGVEHLYWAIDIDPVCVKMTALNYFLSGIQGEVMCANALLPDDFMGSYLISLAPYPCIRRITDRQESFLWNRMQGLLRQDADTASKWNEFMTKSESKGNGSQLRFFD